MHDFAALRQRLVDNQIRPSAVTEHAIIEAFLSVPRELFVAPEDRPFAYSDRDLRYSDSAPGRRMLDPVQLARLIQLLPLRPESKVMVIGSGTGYSAAILARIGAAVVAVEEDQALATAAAQLLPTVGAGGIMAVRAGLTEGWPGEAPYDAILVDGAVEVVPETILSQLKPHGALAAIEISERISRAMLYERLDHGTSKRPRFEAWAALLPGFERKREFAF